jgi:hypothetical protein
MAHGCGYSDTMNKQGPSPLKARDLDDIKKDIKDQRSYGRSERKSGRKAVRKHNAGQYEYINRSEFRANKAEDKADLKSLKNEKKEFKKKR